MNVIPGKSNTFLNADSKKWERRRIAKGKWSEVKLWQIAHRLTPGARLYKFVPMKEYDEIWIVDRVVERGVVVSLKTGSPHQGLEEWLCSCWIEGAALYDESARSFKNAVILAKAVLEHK